LQHPDLLESRRPDLEERREVALRLLYFRSVCRHFAETYGGTLRQGYTALGRPLPAFANLSRQQALLEVAAVAAADDGTRPIVAETRRLLEKGLRELEPAVIPITWA
jgi:hypothetical protein